MKLKISKLLSQRDAMLRQAHLANLAFAYTKLADFAARIERARLRGIVSLKRSPPTGDRVGAALAALSGNQSVIEEHFTDEDVGDLADVIAFITGEGDVDLTFSLEDLGGNFLGPLRRELEQQGVALDGTASPSAENSGRESSSGCPQNDEGS
jgi:hypothetical protein